MQPPASLAFFCVLLVAPSDVCSENRLQQTFSESVGAYNSTYYQLRRSGHVTLVLESLRGDADLYVSGETLMPTYENYDMKSVTCGEDVVVVPADMKRPIGIAVYGHSVLDVNEFRLSVYVDGQRGEGGETTWESSRQHSHHHHGSYLGGAKDEEEPILWTIFVSVLKVIFDILVG